MDADSRNESSRLTADSNLESRFLESLPTDVDPTLGALLFVGSGIFPLTEKDWKDESLLIKSAKTVHEKPNLQNQIDNLVEMYYKNKTTVVEEDKNDKILFGTTLITERQLCYDENTIKELENLEKRDFTDENYNSCDSSSEEEEDRKAESKNDAKIVDNPIIDSPKPVDDRNLNNVEDYDSRYFDAYSDYDIHRIMIDDLERSEVYRKSLMESKLLDIKDKIVMDIGTGSGLLSMFAAKAGAKKVISVDASASMVHLANQNFIKNNLSNTCQAFLTKVEQSNFWYNKETNDVVNAVDCPSSCYSKLVVDVIVSEWMGYALLFENMLPSVIYARNKYLKENGTMIPSTCTMYANYVNDTDYSSWDELKYGLDLSLLKKKIVAKQGSNFFEGELKSFNKEDSDLIIGDPLEIFHADLTKASIDDVTSFHFQNQGLRSSDIVEKKKMFNSLCIWFKVDCQEFELTTSPLADHKTHWKQTFLPLYNESNVCELINEIQNLNIYFSINKNNNRGIFFILTYERNQEELTNCFTVGEE